MEQISDHEVKTAGTEMLSVRVDNLLNDGRFKRLGSIIIPLIFFSCFFIFLLWYINPAAIYSCNGMNIYTYVQVMQNTQNTSAFADQLYRPLNILELKPEYFRSILTSPGGCTRLAVTLGIYACHYPIAGAFIITVLSLFFYWIFTLYLRGIGVRRLFVIPFIPPFFILTMCAWYTLSYCSFLLPVAGALVFVVLYQHLKPRAVLARTLWLSLFFWFSWYFFQWGYLILFLFVIINQFFGKDRGIASVSIISVINCILLTAIDTWLIPFNRTVHWNDFTMLSGLPLAMIGFFPLAAVIAASLSRLLQKVQLKKIKTIIVIVQVIVFLSGSSVATLWLIRDPVNRDSRIIARTMNHIMTAQWDAILNEKTAGLFVGFPQNVSKLQIFMIHAVEHALYNTGRIGDKLFSFPQAVLNLDPLLMLQSMSVQCYTNWIAFLDLAMDLGMVNTAEKVSGELMENMGPFPDIIYRRALIQIAVGNKEAASVYLNKLAPMPFFRAEARRLLNLLNNDKALLSEPRISAMFSNKDTIDYFQSNELTTDFILKNLLQSNSGNKAAYDYLMTHCLLYNNLRGISLLAPMAPRFGYTKLPRIWDEALCYYQAMNSWQSGSSKMSFKGVQKETRMRFKNFSGEWLKLEKDPDAAEKLLPLFGDTYFYYSTFKFSPGALDEK